MAASDIYLCPNTHGPTAIELRTVGPCSDAVTRRAAPFGQWQPQVLRDRGQLRIPVVISGAGHTIASRSVDARAAITGEGLTRWDGLIRTPSQIARTDGRTSMTARCSLSATTSGTALLSREALTPIDLELLLEDQ